MSEQPQQAPQQTLRAAMEAAHLASAPLLATEWAKRFGVARTYPYKFKKDFPGAILRARFHARQRVSYHPDRHVVVRIGKEILLDGFDTVPDEVEFQTLRAGETFIAPEGGAIVIKKPHVENLSLK